MAETTLEVSGRVKSFNRHAGFGFLEVEASPFKRDVFLPLTCVERFGLRTMVDDATVVCKVKDHKDKGPRVTKILKVKNPKS